MSLQDHSNSLTSGRACSDHRELSVLLDHPVSSMHGEPHPCGTEWMPNAKAASPQVELVKIDVSHLLLQTHMVLAEFVASHGFDVGQDLASKCFVILQDRDIA